MNDQNNQNPMGGNPPVATDPVAAPVDPMAQVPSVGSVPPAPMEGAAAPVQVSTEQAMPSVEPAPVAPVVEQPAQAASVNEVPAATETPNTTVPGGMPPVQQ